MAHGEETRRSLRSAYVHQGFSLEAGAEKLGVSFGTASRWKRQAKADGDDWDKARAAVRLSGEGKGAVIQAVIEDYLLLHQAVIEDIKQDKTSPPIKRAEALSRLADAFHKTMHAMGEVSPELSRLAIANEVLRHLSKFIIEKHPEHGIAFVEILEPFGAELARVYG